MAKYRKPTVKKSTKKRLNTTWINNALKSIGAATAANFKEISPTLYNTASAAKEGATSLVGEVRKSKQSLGRLNNAIASNKYVQMAKKSLDQSIQDLKEGNLYNEGRAADAMMGDLDGMFNDFDNWGDEESGTSINFSYVDEGIDAQALNPVQDAIYRSGEASVKAAKATVDTMTSLSSVMLSQQSKAFGEIDSHLTNIESHLQTIVDYFNENTTAFYEAATAAFERIGRQQDPDGMDTYEPDTVSDLFSGKGGLDLRKYKDFVKGNIGKAIENSPAGALLPFLKDDEMLEMLISDPVGGITKGIIGGMIPKVISGTLQELDNTFSNLLPNMLSKLAREAKNSDNSIMKYLGQIFGIDIDKRNQIDLNDRFSGAAATFDDITRNTIVEVLPKYARESTAYLKEIAMHITKKSNEQLLGGSQVFDLTTSSYKNLDDITKGIAESLQEAITNEFKNSQFGKMLETAGGNLDKESKESYDKILNQFFTQLSNNSTLDVTDFNLKDANGAARRALANVDGKGLDKRSKKILQSAIRYMYENNVGVDTASLANIKAANSYNQKVSELAKNPEFSNLIAGGITSETDLAEFIDRYTGNQTAMKNRLAQKRKEEEGEKETDKELRKNRHRSVNKLVRGNLDEYVEAEEARKDRNNNHGKFINGLLTDSFTQGVTSAGGRFKESMWAMMKGDTMGAINSFGQIFQDMAGSVWQATSENFLKPLGEKLFGEKDEHGNSVGGLLSGAKNKINDTWKELMQRINGRDFEDSQGVVHHLDDQDSTLVGKATNLFKDVGESIRFRLFGEKKEEGEEDGKKKTGIIGSMVDSLKEGIKGWKVALFGEDDEDHEVDAKAIKDKVLDAMPDTLLGTGVGAIMGGLSSGSLLGMLVGGPIGGAVIGMAGGLLSRSDKFKNWLFGEEIDDGEGGKQRIGGFISKKTQDFFKNNHKTIVGGAAVGAIKSLIFPKSAGLLTSIVGGPIAGAAVGAGIGLLTKSEMFQKFLYGDEETGRQGVIQAFKNIFKGKGDSEDGDGDKKGVMKALGMGAIGAGAAGLTAALVGKVGLLGAMVTPGGPLGAAIVGAAVGIGSRSKKFANWIFGEKDEEGNRKGGLLQKFSNYVQVELFQPMRSKVLDITDDIKTTVKYDIIENIRAPFVAVAEKAKEAVQEATQRVKEGAKALWESFDEIVLKPFGSLMDKFVVQPIKTVTGKVTDFMYKGTKAIVTAPFKLVGALYKRAIHKNGLIVRGIKGLFNITKNSIKNVFRGIGRAGFGIIRGVAKGVGAVRGVVKGVAGRISDQLEEHNPELVRKFRDWRDRVQIRRNKDDENAQGFLNSQIEAREARAKNRRDRRDRRNLDRNRQMMARILGYDEKFFTEETMAKAEAVAGKKINWKGTKDNRIFDQTPEQKRAELLKKSEAEILRAGATSTDPEIRQLNEEIKTNKKLDDIYKVMHDMYKEMKGEGFSDNEIANSLKNYQNELSDTEDSLGMSDDEKLSNKIGDTGEKILKNTKNWGELVAERIKNEQLETEQNVEDEIRKNGIFGSLKKHLKDKKEAKRRKRFRRMYGDDLADEFEDFEDSFEHRAEGGPVEEGKPYVVGDGGSDPSAKELFVPETSGHILSQKDDGIKVKVTGFVGNAFNQIVKAIRGKFKSTDSNTEDVIVDGPNGPMVQTISAAAAQKLEAAKKAAERKQFAELQASETQAGEDKGTYASLELKRLQEEERAKQARRDEVQEGILDAILGLDLETKEHNSIWDSIFSKKGLIGAGLLALIPFLMKNIGSIIDAIKGIGSNIATQFDFVNNNGGRDNGNTIEEEIGKEKDRVEDIIEDLKGGHPVDAAADFVLDDGQYDAQSGGRASLLMHGAPKLLKFGKSVVKGVKNLGKKGIKGLKGLKNQASWWKNYINTYRNIGKGAAEAGENVAKNAVEEAWGPDDWFEALYEQGFGSLDDAVEAGVKNFGDDALEAGVKNFGDDVVKTGGKLAMEHVDDIAKAGTERGATKVLNIFKGFLDNIVEKVAAKTGAAKGAIGKKLGSITARVGKCLSEKFPRISEKVSAVFAGRTSLDVATLGLDKVAFISIGVINGLGKGAAARLFQIPQDQVDWKMQAISAAFQGFTVGTTTGAIVDIVCGLVADILGVDLLNTVACTIYKAISNEEDDNALDQAQEEWRQSYLEYQDKELQENFETQKALGNVNQETTYEEYKAGVYEGTYDAAYQGFDDWNADQNQSLGYKLGQGISGLYRKAKRIIKGEKAYYDAERDVYYVDIGDNKLEARNPFNNEVIGVVPKESVDLDALPEYKPEVSAVAEGLKDKVTNKFNEIKTKAGKGFNDFKEGAAEKFNAAKETLGNAKDAAVGFITQTGKNIGKGISDFIDNVKNVGNALDKGHDLIVENFNNPDVDFRGYFNANVNTLPEDHPLHGVIGGLLDAEKGISFLPLVLAGIGRRIKKAISRWFNEQKDKIVTSLDGIQPQIQQMDQMAASGDLEGLKSFQPMVNEDNPIAGFAQGFLDGSKMMHYPSTLMHWIGNGIKNWFNDRVNEVKGVISGVSPSMKQMSELAKAGDTDGLEAYIPSIPENTPLTGAAIGILAVGKLAYTPVALFHKTGNAIKQWFTDRINTVKGAIAGLQPSLQEMSQFAKSGDTSGLFNYAPSIPEDTPLSGFMQGVAGLAKFAYAPVTLIRNAGNVIKEKFNSMVEGGKDIASSAKSYINDALKYTDPDSNIGDFYKLEMAGDSPIAGLVSSVIKKPISMYVEMMRAVNGAINFVKDGINNVKEGVTNFASNALDSASNFVNNAGTSLMNFARGGNGTGRRSGGRGTEPESVNGYDYYSQNDSRWANSSYESDQARDGATMGDSGCGPTAMSMVISQTQKNKQTTPKDMANLASKAGFRDDTGTNSKFIDFAGDAYGIPHQDVSHPNGDYILSQVSKGRSVVLNGYSSADEGEPYTTAGHYLVAVGVDEGGNILVNDPRGPEYSSAYSPDELAGQTSEAWSFKTGGNGTRRFRRSGGRGILRRVFGKRGGRGFVVDESGSKQDVKSTKTTKNKEKNKNKTKSTTSTTSSTATTSASSAITTTDTGSGNGDWLQIVRTVKQLVAEKKPTYNQAGSMTINYNGQEIRLRPDCSGLVGCMLRIYGAIPSGQNVTSSSLCSSSAGLQGFSFMPWPGWDACQEGDIITRHGHVEIFCRNENGTHYVYNGGSTDALGSPGATRTGHANGYEYIWRPNNAGTGGGMISGDMGSADSGSTGSNDFLTNFGNLFSQYSTAVMNGMMTGNYDANFTWGSPSSSGTTSGTSAGGTTMASVGSANIQGDNVAQNVWNYFTQQGYSKAAVAGIMGNLYQESGMNPASIQGNGRGPAAGIAQWENYNTKSSRWKAMSDYAASKGKDWTDLGSQLEFINQELQGLGSFWRSSSNMAKAGTSPTDYQSWKSSTSIDAATRQFEGAFERAGKPNMPNRLAAANKYYELYGNDHTGGLGTGKSTSKGNSGSAGSKSTKNKDKNKNKNKDKSKTRTKSLATLKTKKKTKKKTTKAAAKKAKEILKDLGRNKNSKKKTSLVSGALNTLLSSIGNEMDLLDYDLEDDDSEETGDQNIIDLSDLDPALLDTEDGGENGSNIIDLSDYDPALVDTEDDYNSSSSNIIDLNDYDPGLMDTEDDTNYSSNTLASNIIDGGDEVIDDEDDVVYGSSSPASANSTNTLSSNLSSDYYGDDDDFSYEEPDYSSRNSADIQSTNNYSSLSTKDKLNYGVQAGSGSGSSSPEIISLMNNIISLLQTIGTNTENLEKLETGTSITNNNSLDQSSGGTVVVNNQEKTSNETSKFTQRDSKNGKLSLRIARGI